MDRKTKGKLGEAIAKRYYEANDFEILESNYRFKRAEIDLIVLKEEKLLVFVEVKKRSNKDFGEPETFVSEAQKQRIKIAAEDYIYAINWQKDIRFDIVSIDIDRGIEVFEDAF